jgi:hypothetical protein
LEKNLTFTEGSITRTFLNVKGLFILSYVFFLWNGFPLLGYKKFKGFNTCITKLKLATGVGRGWRKIANKGNTPVIISDATFKLY